jgi:septal ring factor EnvC (AmiA/AmiB activator)
MKRFLPNLLIIFSLGLCGLIAVQWVRESHNRDDISHLNQTVYERDATVQGLNATIKKDDAEINRLDARNLELKETIKSNQDDIVLLRKNLKESDSKNVILTNKIEEYKAAVERQNDSIRKQNESIADQNTVLKKLGEERNEWILKYNDSVSNYNKLVSNYNHLVEQVKQIQEQQQPKEKK